MNTVLLMLLLTAGAPLEGALQTFFAVEEPLQRAVAPPAQVVAFLLQQPVGEDLRACAQRDENADVARYLVASSIDLNDDRRPDYVVTAGERCLQGAHAQPYWVFVARAKGFRLVHDEVGDGLTLEKARAHGFRDITVFHHTAVTAFFKTERWNGRRYVPVACRSEDAFGAPVPWPVGAANDCNTLSASPSRAP